MRSRLPFQTSARNTRTLPFNWVVAILLLCILSTTSNAQTPDQVSGNGCLTIQSDWPMCSAFQGLPLDTQAPPSSILSLLFAKSSSSDTRPLSSLFSENFAAFLDSSRIRMPNGLNVTYSQNFKDRYNCPGYTHFHRRFLISMWCTDFVFSSSQTCPTPANVQLRPLCRSTCNTFSDSSLASFQNATQCPPPPNDLSRNNGATEIPGFCQLPLFSGVEPNCISGDTIEPETCGYLLNSRVCDMALCSSARQACIRRGVPLINENFAANNTTGGTNSSVKVSALIIGSIISGILFLLLAIVGFIYWRKYTLRKQATGSFTNMESQEKQSTGGGSAAKRTSKRISSLIQTDAGKTVSISELLMSLERHTANTLNHNQSMTSAPPMVEYDKPLQHIAIRSYAPAMDDEMELEVDDVIALTQSYNDGWAFGLNLTTGQMGVLPIGFIQPMVVDVDVNSVKTRMSKYGDSNNLNQVKAIQNSRVSVTDARLSAQTMFLQSEAGTLKMPITKSNQNGGGPAPAGSNNKPVNQVATDNVNSDDARQVVETMFLTEDDEVAFNKISNSRVTIDTVMEVLAQIAKTDRGSRMLTDLNLNKALVDQRDPQVRQSIIQGIKRERFRSINGDVYQRESTASSRFSFGTLMDVLEDHGGGEGSEYGSDYDDDPVDSATLANTLLNAYNIGGDLPPLPPVTNSMYQQQLGSTSSSFISNYDSQGEVRPISTLSDLDRLETLLGREEKVLRDMRG